MCSKMCILKKKMNKVDGIFDLQIQFSLCYYVQRICCHRHRSYWICSGLFSHLLFYPFAIIIIGRIFILSFCCAFNNQHGKVERALCLRLQFVCLSFCVFVCSSTSLSHTYTHTHTYAHIGVRRNEKEIYVQYCAVLYFLFTIKWQYLYEYTSMELALEAVYVHIGYNPSAVCMLSHP